MNTIFKRLFVCLAFSCCFLFSNSGYAFDVKTFDQKKVKLESLVGKGKWSLVMFWAHDCTICRSEVKTLSAFHNKRHKKDVEVIGLSIDGDKKLKEAQGFIEQTSPSFPSYIADISLVAINYEIMTGESFRGTPTFVLFGPDGSIMANNAGPFPINKLDEFIARNQ